MRATAIGRGREGGPTASDEIGGPDREVDGLEFEHQPDALTIVVP